MSYIFSPLSEEELDMFELLEPGIYPFEILKSTRKISKSGNNMAELQISIYDKKGINHFIYDYLVFSSVNLNIKKVKHFCDSVGLQEEYRKGKLPEDLNRYTGKLELGIQGKRPKEDGSFWPSKNIVIYYLSKDKESDYSGMKPLEDKKDDFNDEIPF